MEQESAGTDKFAKATGRLVAFAEALMSRCSMKNNSGVATTSTEIIRIFDRMTGMVRSLSMMNTPQHYEASALIAAAVFEMFMDIRLLSDDKEKLLAEKYREYFNLQRFRSAHRIVSFYEDVEGATTLDVEEQLRFKSDCGGIAEIRKRVAEVWGPDNRGKSSYPVHWSGRKCTRILAHELGSEYEELYIESYAVLAWLINTGLSGEAGDKQKTETLKWCHGVAQLSYVEAILIICGRLEEETFQDWLVEARDKLRKNPGDALNCEDVKMEY